LRIESGRFTFHFPLFTLNFLKPKLGILKTTPYLCRLKKNLKEVYTMLIIDSKDCENIDKALKKYKKKFEKSRTLLQLRERQSFTKPSVKRRGEMLKAVYKQQLASGLFD
jgi:small subunit ribosomal protein S21